MSGWSNDTALALKPDGAGGLAFGSVGGATFAYTANPDYSMYGTNNTAQAGGIPFAMQMGFGATVQAGAYYAIAMGFNATANGSSVVIGGKSTAISPESAVLGYNNHIYASAQRSVAIGNVSIVGAGAYSSIAIGRDAGSYAPYGTAIGSGSRVIATHSNSVSIGTGVQSTATNEVNLGASNTNKITFDTWTATISAGTASTHKVPILLGGIRYNLLVSNV